VLPAAEPMHAIVACVDQGNKLNEGLDIKQQRQKNVEKHEKSVVSSTLSPNILKSHLRVV
jgi:hypothetical protein